MSCSCPPLSHIATPHLTSGAPGLALFRDVGFPRSRMGSNFTPSSTPPGNRSRPRSRARFPLRSRSGRGVAKFPQCVLPRQTDGGIGDSAFRNRPPLPTSCGHQDRYHKLVRRHEPGAWPGAITESAVRRINFTLDSLAAQISEANVYTILRARIAVSAPVRLPHPLTPPRSRIGPHLPASASTPAIGVYHSTPVHDSVTAAAPSRARARAQSPREAHEP